MDAYKAIGMYGSMWLVDDAAADSYLAFLEGVDLGKHALEFEAARKADPSITEMPPYVVDSGIAMFSIEGMMTRKPHSMQAILGGTSTIQLRQQLRDGRKDPNVKSAVLCAYTPGGAEHGLSDLGDEIAAFAAVKPIVGYVPEYCASAGMWAISQCSMVIAGPGASLGSIGVYRELTDSSRAAENAGITRTLARNKEATVKGMGVPGVPISPAMKADADRLADCCMDLFATAIARGRGMDKEDVLAMATGQMYYASDALALGLIDGIMSLDDVMDSLRSGDWPDGISIADHGGEDVVSMGLKEMVALFSGRAKSEEEKTAAAALETELAAKEEAQTKAAQLETENKKLTELLAKATTAATDSEAQSFAMALCNAGKLTAAETGDVIALYQQAHEDDKKDGGIRLKSFKSMCEARPANKVNVASSDEDLKVEGANADGILKVLLERPAAANQDRGEFEALAPADTSSGVHLMPKSMTADERKAAVAKARNGRGS